MAEPQETNPDNAPPDLSNWQLTPETAAQGSFKQKVGGFFKSKFEGLNETRRRVVDKIVDINQRSEEFLNSIHIREGLSQAVEKVTHLKPSREQLDNLARSAANRISGVKVLGQPLVDMVSGAVAGAGAKELARISLAISGLGGLPIAAAVGAAGGAGSAVVREYLKQRRDITIEEDTETKGLRNAFKNEFRRLQASDKQKLRNAALRGAVFGAVGGIAGGVIVDALAGRLGEFSLPAVSIPEVQIPEFVQEVGKTVGGAAQEVGKTASGVVQTVRERLPGQPPAEATATPTPTPTETLTPGPTGTPIPTETPVAAGAAVPTETPIPTETDVPAEVSPTPTPAETVTPTAPETPLEQPAAEAAKPEVAESVKLPPGSNPWNEVSQYLHDQLGRNPTNLEIRQAVTQLLADNDITDATRIPAGTELNLEGVNQYLGQILSEQPPIPADLAALPENISLPSGSNPWNEVSKYLETTLERPPSNAEILDVTKELCRQSGIGVPSWGIAGADLHTQLPPGKILVFNEFVKERIANIAA